MTEIPSVGTQTFFTSLAACYMDLSNQKKEEWKSYKAIYGHNGTVHPLIWKHPFNGQSVLYFDVGEVCNIVIKDTKDQLSVEKTNALISDYAVAHRTNLLFKNYKQTMLCTTTKGIYF